MIKVITAIESLANEKDLSVFLGGGIHKCGEWQKTVIDGLSDIEDMSIIVYNPRRANFPINDPNAAFAQIDWEFEALNKASVFSMWFCNADSDQPICMYELGRHLAMRPASEIVIGIEPGYRREVDVFRQTYLVYKHLQISRSLEDHIHAIKHKLWTQYVLKKAEEE